MLGARTDQARYRNDRQRRNEEYDRWCDAFDVLQHERDRLQVPEAILGAGEHFVLEISGDSMINAGILDGDYVVIRKTDTANSGDIVVALVQGEEATLKRLRRKGASIALEPLCR